MKSLSMKINELKRINSQIKLAGGKIVKVESEDNALIMDFDKGPIDTVVVRPWHDGHRMLGFNVYVGETAYDFTINEMGEIDNIFPFMDTAEMFVNLTVFNEYMNVTRNLQTLWMSTYDIAA